MLRRILHYFFLIYLISGYNKISDKSLGRFTKSISFSKYLGSKDKEEVFFCESCGTEHIKWVGRCNSCKEWNTVKPFKVPKMVSSINSKSFPKLEKNRINSDQGFLTQKETLIPLSSVDTDVAASRIKVWSSELNRVLGGGIVKGSVILLTGEPGIGKRCIQNLKIFI
jgi:predicted ATP-dependent serine protease